MMLAHKGFLFATGIQTEKLNISTKDHDIQQEREKHLEYHVMSENEALDRNINILIVDDVYATRRVLKRLLKKIGYSSLDEAPSGAEAVEKIKAGEFQLVVCDYNLGDMDGVDILREIKAEESLKKLPFVMISSDPTIEQIEATRKLGICHYLLKPFDSEKLQEKIVVAFNEQTEASSF